jgi:predicted O-linked N-acetylglucosamine transferase (SPINDLY family)
MNIGNALHKLGRRQDAMAAYRQAVACEPAYAPAKFNLGALLIECGQLDLGATELLAAVQQQPDLVDARLLLADTYEKLGRSDAADDQFAAALKRAPDHAGALLNFGTYCLRQGRFGEASQLLRRARVANPELDDVVSFNVFALNFRSDVDAETIAAEHRAAGLHLQRRAGEPFRHWTNVPDPDRRLRIGYVSGDFAHHPVALFLRPVLEQHDPSAFEVFCYSNVAGDNEIADVLRGHAHHWREIAGMSDAEVANVVRDDGIDILVDLSGHTTGNRLGVFALHPAPVQVTWLGYLNTTGLAAIDYRITDRHTDPPGTTERLHSERLVRMPDSQWCYAPWHRVEPVSAPHPARPDALVFGSFNQAVKITDATLTLWSRILAALPAAKLVVLDVRPITEAQLRRRMATHGIDASRVTLVGRVDIDAYFAAIGDVDIALDTTPYNGATTTLDTLWMGVPIVALRGDRGVSRGSYSILSSLGADELIASTADEYVDLNVRLAVDVGWRKRLRATLHDRLIRSPLMEAAGFTSALEARFVEMWRAWCAGQR